METKIRNGQILSSIEALEEIKANPSLPIKLSYAASKNLSRLEKEAEDLQNFKMELLKNVAEFDEDTGMIMTVEDEDGNPTNEIRFKSEADQERYVNHMNELYKDEVALSLHSVDINTISDIWLEPRIVFSLEWMFKDGFDFDE